MPDEIARQSWPTLSSLERRLLGVLVEKQKTTPDVYPMTLNALVTGSNQKSNRDPMMSVEDHEVEAAMEGLQRQALATRVESGRVDKWRHLLYEQWHVSRVEIAVLAELLLRGPQTEGDLRSRVGRMETVADLETLRAVCQPMAQRGLVVYLTPEGRRGTMLTHGFHEPQELERLRSRVFPEPTEARPPTPSSSSATPDNRFREEIAELRKLLADQQQQLTAIRSQVEALQTALGVRPSL